MRAARELRLGLGIRITGIVLVVEGAALIALGIAVLAALGSPAVLVGGWLLARHVLALRKIRRGPGRAYQLNA